MTDLVRFDEPEEKANIIKVMGVGGGGSNAVTHMFSEGITGVDFILCNTDDQALQRSPVENKLHIGDHALGAGNIPAVGRQAAEQTEDRIREALQDDTKMLFITAGMGGGTGTGAAPVVAKIARELGILTVGIVTLPFSFEGKRRQQQAQEGIAELRKQVDALLVISNDKLREEYGNMKLTEAFKKADDILKIAAKGIAEIITVTGYVNVDFEDVNNVMRNSGKAIMGSGYAVGEDRALRAVEEAVNSPLLDDSDITGAKNILVYITSGTEEVSLDEVTEINEYVQDATGKVSEVIWGNGEDLSLENGLRVTLIATGFGEVPEKKEEPIRHTFAENKLKEPEKEVVKQPVNIVFDDQDDEEEVEQKVEQEIEQPVEQKVEEPVVEEQQPVVEEKREEPAPTVKRHVLYDDDFSSKEEENDDDYDDNGGGDSGIKVRRITPDQTSSNEPAAPSVKRYDNPFRFDDDDVDVPGFKNMVATKIAPAQVKQLDQKEMLRRQRFMSFNTDFRNQANLESLENIPAYARMGMNIAKEDNEMSRFSVNKESGLREENSFLHDNVD
ncbi:MAG: cell division protein FtsZ [Bacteroidales bacterium]|nr:cell division protein FtsZ [Bacteroidales bacterium]